MYVFQEKEEQTVVALYLFDRSLTVVPSVLGVQVSAWLSERLRDCGCGWG